MRKVEKKEHNEKKLILPFKLNEKLYLKVDRVLPECAIKIHVTR